MNKAKIHNLDEIEYNLAALRMMIGCLGDNLSDQQELLQSQCDKLEDSILENQTLISKSIALLLDDLSLDIKYLEFDTYATKVEHKKLLELVKKLTEGDEGGH